MLIVERVREVLDYNPETGVFTWKISRKGAPFGKVAGSLGGGDDGLYWVICVDYERYYAHRLAWFYVYGVWPTRLDHKDTIKHHNAILNLREATTVQNSGNMRAHRKNKLGLKGVRLHSSGRYYQARIGVDHKDIHLGYFPTAEEAHEAYMVAAKKLHGDFARG